VVGLAGLGRAAGLDEGTTRVAALLPDGEEERTADLMADVHEGAHTSEQDAGGSLEACAGLPALLDALAPRQRAG